MSVACAIAAGAASALGLGAEAYRVAEDGAPARRALAEDPVLAAAGLARPRAGRAPSDLGVAAAPDRATTLLLAALSQTIAELDRVRPEWRSLRLGIAVGTSSGGMLTAERFFAARAAAHESGVEGEDLAGLARGATYFAPLDDALDAVGLARVERRTQVLAACAASTIAIGLGHRWLRRGACDLVLAGGYDAVSVFVAAGFEVLRATTASSPRPFCSARDGMSLGEGAGIVALVREADARRARVLLRVAGFGASTDAVHITAPDRSGSGLRRAAEAAIADARVPASAIGLVSAHATATPFNDAMESRAIAAVFDGAPRPVVHPFKSQIGHTLGAAGVLESLAAGSALAAQIAPAAAVPEDERDPDAPALLLPCGERRDLLAALKLSAAFGGANAALVLTRDAAVTEGVSPAPALRRVGVVGYRHVASADLGELADATGVPRDRLARLDELCRLGLAAVTALAVQVGALAGAGIVAGHGLATIETNEQFDSRRRARGATHVEPRLFPSTSPNAIAGECAIVHKLTGPSFAVGAGLDGGMEALAAAAELVAAGDSDRMVVLAADDGGPVSVDVCARTGSGDRELARGAVAALLVPLTEGTRPVDLDRMPTHGAGPIGHLSLLRWLSEPASG